jgi:hypothetical protein
MLKRHAFSFGLQGNPPEGARTISSKAPPPPKKGLVSDRIFGEYRGCHTFDIPRPCRDTGPPLLAGFVFLGLNVSEFSANQCAVPRSRPLADSRQRGGLNQGDDPHFHLDRRVEAIASTLPAGTVGYEPELSPKGEGWIWLETAMVKRLRACATPTRATAM